MPVDAELGGGQCHRKRVDRLWRLGVILALSLFVVRVGLVRASYDEIGCLYGDSTTRALISWIQSRSDRPPVLAHIRAETALRIAVWRWWPDVVHGPIGLNLVLTLGTLILFSFAARACFGPRAGLLAIAFGANLPVLSRLVFSGQPEPTYFFAASLAFFLWSLNLRSPRSLWLDLLALCALGIAADVRSEGCGLLALGMLAAGWAWRERGLEFALITAVGFAWLIREVPLAVKHGVRAVADNLPLLSGSPWRLAWRIPGWLLADAFPWNALLAAMIIVRGRSRSRAWRWFDLVLGQWVLLWAASTFRLTSTDLERNIAGPLFLSMAGVGEVMKAGAVRWGRRAATVLASGALLIAIGRSWRLPRGDPRPHAHVERAREIGRLLGALARSGGLGSPASAVLIRFAEPGDYAWQDIVLYSGVPERLRIERADEPIWSSLVWDPSQPLWGEAVLSPGGRTESAPALPGRARILAARLHDCVLYRYRPRPADDCIPASKRS